LVRTKFFGWVQLLSQSVSIFRFHLKRKRLCPRFVRNFGRLLSFVFRQKKSNNKKKIIVRSYPTVWGGFGHGVGLLRTAVIWVRQPHRLKKKTPFTENLNMYKSKTSKMKVEEKKSSNLNQSSQELYLTL
jgi:hypothetical protein